MTKDYSNGEITVHWEPGKCEHAGVCVKTLPKVYKPKEKPWINIENASSEELKKQIDQCPSKALTYSLNKGD
ncbi:(4Fe-4S)-binding protein [Flavobacteriales bacterium]|nr:(4Fe-4S)-binding protein [Flavobacteriales bacterium]